MLTFQKKDPKNDKKLELLQQIPLDGAEIRKVYDGVKDMKYAIEVIHPNKKVINVENLILIPSNEYDSDRWYYALLTICTPHNGFVDFESNQKLYRTFDDFWNTEEKAHWMNAIWSRIHLNMRSSTQIKSKITNSLSSRIKDKIKEKQLEQYITFSKISFVDIGSKPPTIENAILLPPDNHTGDLMIDLLLSYSDGDASAQLSLILDFDILSKKAVSIPIHVTATIGSMSGKIQLRCPPFPAERFSFSFYEEPEMGIDVDIRIGNYSLYFLKKLILPRIERLISEQLKIVIIEKFVAPHRKYVRIPTTNEKENNPETI